MVDLSHSKQEWRRDDFSVLPEPGRPSLALQMSVLKPLDSKQFRIQVGPSGSNIHGLQNLARWSMATNSLRGWLSLCSHPPMHREAVSA